MAANKCSTCNIVGKVSLTRQFVDEEQIVIPCKIARWIYDLGNGDSTSDEGEAKDHLLKRDYPEIFNLNKITENDFKPGSIGIKFLPEVFLSKIPKMAEPQKHGTVWPKIAQIYSTPEKQNIVLEHIREEGSELTVIDGIATYYEKCKNEDIFIFFNQDFEDKVNKRWLERDALIVNCTRGYIVVVEAKSELTKSKLSQGSKQLKETMENILKPISLSLSQNWDVYFILYGTSIDSSIYVCPSCKPFVLTKSNGTFSKLLQNILSYQGIKDWTYAKDFQLLIKEVLPLRVRIAKNLVSAFTAKQSLLEKISRNVQQAGIAEVIAFWTRIQFNLAHDCVNCKRVLFDSCFSTGKTLLMRHCIEKLLKKNEKVLFLINTEGNMLPPTLLLLKLKEYFHQMYQNTPIENNIIVEECNLNEEGAFDDKLKEHQDYHIFIDEIRFEHCIDYATLIKWNNLISVDKHFWIAICYGKENFDRNQLTDIFFPFQMEYLLRNNRETVQMVQGNLEANSSSALNDKTKIGEMKIPTNMTRSFDPSNYVFETDNYTNGLRKALTALLRISETRSALIVIPWLKCSTDKWCRKCYGDQNNKISQFKKHIYDLYQQLGRQDPIVYFSRNELPEANDWVKNPNAKDMVTDYEVVNGFEHDVVIIVQKLDQNTFEHNMVMRSITLPIIVKISSEQWSEKCFGKCH